MSRKTKVAWICHFTNNEVQDILKPFKKINEFAPWIPSLTKVLENQDKIELFIISPHEYISGIKQYNLRGVHYYFFNGYIPFWGRHWPGIFKLDYWTDFLFNKLQIKRIINQIRPDIIHLQGAENANYSSSIFQFKNKYPILITIQGFLHRVAGQNSNIQIKKRVKCELAIYKAFNHFGYRTKKMGEILKEINPNVILHWHGYGISLDSRKENTSREKKYDLVYFASITKIKGIEDLLKAISLIKKRKKDISAIIIGAVSKDYLKKLKQLCQTLEIQNNITWIGFLNTQIEVHDAASEAKLCVLPVQDDIIPGTIVESLLIHIPVVTYNVGSIHEINEKEEVISLVEKDNIGGLVEEIMKLLENDILYQERSDKGFERILEMLDNSRALDDLLNAYEEVLADFKRQI